MDTVTGSWEWYHPISFLHGVAQPGGCWCTIGVARGSFFRRIFSQDVGKWRNLIQWPYRRFDAVWFAHSVGKCFEFPAVEVVRWATGLSSSWYCQISARCKSLQAGFWFPKSRHKPLQWLWLQNFIETWQMRERAASLASWTQFDTAKQGCVEFQAVKLHNRLYTVATVSPGVLNSVHSLS